ncbi:hypothetical protein HDU83_000139 [Entophlyctis luteolus]|nr:hypothetical protein HDU83_000139 [Entophlyctis luteolus]
MVHPRVALSLEIQGLDADFEEEKKSFKSSSKPSASENDRFKETGLSNSESPSRTRREETSDIHINTCKEHENDHLPVNNESEVGLSICHGGDEVSGRYGADHSEIVLEETLQDISIISETAEEVLAALDMCDELDNGKLKLPRTSSASEITPNKQIRLQTDKSNNISSNQKAMEGVSSSSLSKKFSPCLSDLRRKSVKPPLSVALAQRKMTAKLTGMQAARKHARDAKVSHCRQIADDFSAQEESSDASRSDNDAENRGAVERDRIKLPMDAIARKERGEVLWTVPHASPVNKAAGSSGDYASYIPKEDERTAQAIEQVLGVVPAGSTAEWELIAGRGRSKLRRSG